MRLRRALGSDEEEGEEDRGLSSSTRTAPSLRNKISVSFLLGSVAFLLLFYLLLLGGSWRSEELSRNEYLFIEAQRQVSLSSSYTLRMNTFRRNDRLKKAVEHFAACPRVHSIQVVWSDLKNAPPPLSFFSPSSHSKLAFEVHPVDSLNNRFDAILPIPTEAVFSVDDDLLIDCSTLDLAFYAWESAPDTLVGFAPRAALLQGDSYRYRTQWWTWWNGWYNIILTKACFMHRRYVQGPYMELPPSILEHIDAHMNCEDIAMQFVVANMSGSPPLWVKGYMTDFGDDGISAGQGHFDHRSQCIDRLVEAFQGMPLRFSQALVLPAAQGRWGAFLA